jgi:hypothetical protein
VRPRRPSAPHSLYIAALGCLLASRVVAQGSTGADPASRAFEEGRWEDAIAEYRLILEGYPDDRLGHLRIAQAERELGRHEQALATLERARAATAPPAMVELERVRNLLALGRRDDALVALIDADHNALRAFTLLSESHEFDGIRDTPQFREVLRNVRARVYPCESIPEYSYFDFWLGEWEVRTADGALAGHNTISKEKGGCEIREHWRGTGGGEGTSTSFYLPSRDQWRQIWVGSNATLIDMTGNLIEGEMRMEGTIEYAHRDRVVAFRAAGSTNEDRSVVRQRMEEFDLGTSSWRPWFDGFYRRKPGGQERGAEN